MGVFIKVRVKEGWLTTDQGRALAASCPVDIFRWAESRLLVHPEQEDECTLCELCLDLTPAGAVTICKKYKEETLISRGSATAGSPDDN